MPTIYKSWDLLREKLRKIDRLEIDKRVGVTATLVFELKYHKYDPKIPIIETEELNSWLETRRKSSTSPKSSTPIKSASRASSPPPPKPRQSPQVPQSRQSPQAPQPQQSPQAPQSPQQSPQSSFQLRQSPPTLKLPIPKKPIINLISPKAPLKTTIKFTDRSTKSKPRGQIVKSRPKSKPQRTDSSSADSPTSQESISNISTAACISSIDVLVINERIDDEYANYVDDDFEEETEMSKNLKKIRSTAPPVAKPQPPPPPPPKPNLMRQSNDMQRSRVRDSPPPTPKPPPKPREPNWPETASHLQQNNFHYVCKDFETFKNHVKSDSTARSLLKDAVMKCIQEDETLVLLDLLNLVYDNGYTDDIQFWSELFGRLRRKLDTHTRTFKARTDPKWVRENYKRALKSISDHAKEVDQSFTVPIHAMKLLYDPIGCLEEKTLDTNPTLPSTSSKNEPQPTPTPPPIPNQILSSTSTKIEPPPLPSPSIKINLRFPVLNPMFKVEKQENVEPAEQRQKSVDSIDDRQENMDPVEEKQKNIDPAVASIVTLFKNAQGNTCFKIVKQKSNTPVFSRRL